MSRDLGTKPSDVLGFADPVLQFYFDRSVWLFGSQVQADIDRAIAKAKTDKAKQSKQEQVLKKWIPEKQQERKFKDPAMRFK